MKISSLQSFIYVGLFCECYKEKFIRSSTIWKIWVTNVFTTLLDSKRMVKTPIKVCICFLLTIFFVTLTWLNLCLVEYVKINVITTDNGSKYKTLQSGLNSLIIECCKTEYSMMINRLIEKCEEKRGVRASKNLPKVVKFYPTPWVYIILNSCIDYFEFQSDWNVWCSVITVQ